jgi:hypothetical protein
VVGLRGIEIAMLRQESKNWKLVELTKLDQDQVIQNEQLLSLTQGTL